MKAVTSAHLILSRTCYCRYGHTIGTRGNTLTKSACKLSTGSFRALKASSNFCRAMPLRKHLLQPVTGSHAASKTAGAFLADYLLSYTQVWICIQEFPIAALSVPKASWVQVLLYGLRHHWTGNRGWQLSWALFGALAMLCQQLSGPRSNAPSPPAW